MYRKISDQILDWYQTYGRSFSWREKKYTPYQIFIIEMLLRRTQAKKVEEIAPSFFKRYPTINELSNAKLPKLTDLIKSLGLQNQRAQTLFGTAQIIIEQFGGKIPRSKKELEKIQGIGPYISSAIQCYVFDEEVPIVDSNVSRFLSRLFGLNIKKKD